MFLEIFPKYISTRYLHFQHPALQSKITPATLWSWRRCSILIEAGGELPMAFRGTGFRLPVIWSWSRPLRNTLTKEKKTEYTKHTCQKCYKKKCYSNSPPMWITMVFMARVLLPESHHHPFWELSAISVAQEARNPREVCSPIQQHGYCGTCMHWARRLSNEHQETSLTCLKARQGCDSYSFFPSPVLTIPPGVALMLLQAATCPGRNNKQQSNKPETQTQAAHCNWLRSPVLSPARRFQSLCNAANGRTLLWTFPSRQPGSNPAKRPNRRLCEGRKQGVGWHPRGAEWGADHRCCARAHTRAGCAPCSSPGAVPDVGSVLENCPGSFLAVSPGAPYGIAPTVIMSPAGLPSDLKIV